ncbi:endolytic transglycosylase MltG [Streptomyces sp. SP18CS02]|uniref:endolytic transglycosylase MltG n=1 Tax=Streptomyces sp. SP18CS02 TaxID=3002531 RepID=UPI002E7627FE|nr:endolytic transglycosylase MltG [Streptomyces sp. SP18CS02]MEE1755384.1 endolytic transglycosylase MltG [Streptomyces sp. SP18CS02]
MVNEPPWAGPRRRPRTTRRRRWILALAAAVAVGVAAAVLVPLLLVKEPPEKPKTLLVPEGWRATQVYAAVDKVLGVPAGTTRKVAADGGLRLPADAQGNPEGFLFPATYPVTSTTTPESLLRYMVSTADRQLGADRLAAGARRNGVSPYQTVTIASIVQAEADTAEDMGKVARVIYNRIARGMALQMDSTLNYALGRSTLDTTRSDTRIDSPYNTYARQGLPPTPIANPGAQAVRAAVDPPPGDWLYFVTVKPGDTRFTDSYAEQQRNVMEFNENRRAATAG